MQNNSNNGNRPPAGGQGNGGNNNRRRRYHNNRGQNPNQTQGQNQQGPRNNGDRPEDRNREFQNHNRSRRPNGRVLTSNQVLVKYDNLLEQHLITRRKYFEFYNRVDERQLIKLENNFFDSIEHLRRFEAGLEPWQREALEKRKTERYRLDLTYSSNHDLEPQGSGVEVKPEEIEDPHFKDTQKEAFEEYKEDTEESEGTFEDYLKLKGLV